jgi:hypothetical protein
MTLVVVCPVVCSSFRCRCNLKSLIEDTTFLLYFIDVVWTDDEVWFMNMTKI